MNVHVDTLEYAQMLEEAGMVRAHAEAVAKLQARTVKDLIDHELVTQDHLKAGLDSLETKLRDEIRSESAKLREEIRGESAKLREEIRAEATNSRRQIDAVMIQIRALQIGAGIAAFALSAILLLSRLIR